MQDATKGEYDRTKDQLMRETTIEASDGVGQAFHDLNAKAQAKSNSTAKMIYSH